ncbi:hotdog fold thioesterase [Maribacter sp. MMG018]|uniref:hotdog fold thioesterase n=1 Tax=Maribacter sp. MMG018 TaxID=2822688 RepID=UPI001B37C2B8|nr:hotdog fold thioesterase [Maribacter sp. MMG018]MBQ4915478.1 hotdog fold thioesterase [Maribacter sp. MMG018]
MIEKNIEFIKKTIEEGIPIHKFLGLKLLVLEKGFVRVSVPFRDEVVGDIRRNRWHGGIIATIMDSVGGIAGGTHFTSFEDKLATIDLRIDYLKGAEALPIIVEGKIVRLGNRILVTKMKAFQKDELIAEGKGVYNFIRIDNSDKLQN